MSSGPIVIFDKSLLEALSLDEAVWLGQFYRINMTPLFFVETLADLEKAPRDDRTPEQVVERLAEKTTAISADPNVHHSRLCAEDLVGNHVDMRRCVVMGGGRSVQRDGHEGIIFDEGPEAQALDRWRRGQFREVERAHAKAWRAALANLDLEAIAEGFKPLMTREDRPRSLKDIKALVERVLTNPAISEGILGAALKSLSVPYELWPRIHDRWQRAGKPVLPAFAPYAAHVMAVGMFFSIAVAGGHIAKERASNKADIAYLYYLPFCMVFTSMDKLHARTVPLFMNSNQRFVWGADMKADLKRLDEHFSDYPDDVKIRGVMSFAHCPPLEGDFMTTRLWDEFLSPIWRKPQDPRPDPNTDPAERDRVDALLRELNARIKDSSPTGREVQIESADFVVAQRSVPVQVGKWRLVSPEAEKASRDGKGL